MLPTESVEGGRSRGAGLPHPQGGRAVFKGPGEVAADPDCALDWLLELDGSYSGGILSLNYTLTLPESATWSNYLILISPSVQVIPLFSVPLPLIPIEFSLPLAFPFPSLGQIGIYSGLFTAGGAEATVLEWIMTK